MSLEDELLRQRHAKLHQIRKLGFDPYGTAYPFTHTLDRILSDYGNYTSEELETRVEVRVAGRIQSLRRMGKKAAFIHLLQNSEKLQLYIRQDAVDERSFALFELLDIGDIIGASGYLFRTKTGELSIHAESLTFLSKILLPLPEKWHGLEDIETRYRQRYVDLIANPEVRSVFVTRAKIIAAIRAHLNARQFLEVETPMMQTLYGGAAARPFTTHHNALDIDLYLRIAPELYLKRLVVGGLERVYEINRNFRNEGISVRHNPEFTMLEVYQAYSDMQGMMELTEEMLRQVAVEATGSSDVTYGEHTLNFAAFQRYTMREAVCRFWPDPAAAPTPEQVRDPGWLLAHAHLQGAEATPGNALVALFEEHAEQHLIQPTFIYDFPAEVSPLSKTRSDDPNFVDRFELYMAGMEVANAFTELNDPQEQRRRFEAQLARKAGGDQEAHLMDEDYIRALSYGMPPAGGAGIGIDRLTMVLTNSRSLRDVILFPLLRPEAPFDLVERLRELEP